MPAAGCVYDMRKSRQLRRGARARSASYATQRYGAVALAVGLCAAGCATAPVGRERPAATIDFRDAAGHRGDLDAYRGKVVVVDVCTSWAAACNVNAKVLDDVAVALHGEPVFVVTVLVDDESLARVALQSYAEVLGVKHAVVIAGPRVRAGTSALGEASYVPRLVILDRDGAVRVDDSGGVLNEQGLVRRVRPLLR